MSSKITTKKLEDMAAERAVIAALCQYGLDAYLEIDFIQSDHFTNEMNQLIFSCVQKSIFDTSKVELSSILSAGNDLGIYDQINTKDEIGFIRSLFNFPILKDNIGIHASKLAKLKLARDLKKTLKACEKHLDSLTGDEDIIDVISKVEEPILDATGDIYKGSSKQTELIGEDLDEYVQYLIDNPSDFAGIPSGFPRFDVAIGGGLRRKCVDLVAARPKVGKSMFGDAVAMHVSGELNIPVLVLDTEMSKKDHHNRMLACLSGVEINKITTGRFAESEIDKEKVLAASDKLKKIPYHYISIAGESFENILSQMRKWIYQHVGFDDNGQTKDCLIVYDYLKLMGSEGISSSMQEYQVLGFQITKLHNFMVKYDVPCLAFVQLNRDGITRETTDVVSGSDRLIWLCTSFSIFKLKSDEEIADDGVDHGNRKLVPVVARHGEGLDDGDYISMKMFGKYGRIDEGSTRNEIHLENRSRNEGFEINEELDEESDISDM
jgi:replicative DNA helicase|tara:strand:+ start:6337 stop:7815 length:1479 start_codon:yes stop_codon:yes gene_type:complete